MRSCPTRTRRSSASRREARCRGSRTGSLTRSPNHEGPKSLSSGTPRKIWSGKPGSNRRPSAWEADALPTELFPRRGLCFCREGPGSQGRSGRAAPCGAGPGCGSPRPADRTCRDRPRAPDRGGRRRAAGPLRRADAGDARRSRTRSRRGTARGTATGCRRSRPARTSSRSTSGRCSTSARRRRSRPRSGSLVVDGAVRDARSRSRWADLLALPAGGRARPTSTA